MVPTVASLVLSSLQPSSLPTYRRAWKLFEQFHCALFPGSAIPFPITPAMLALFVAYLYNKRYAPSTVNTYVSALGYLHKLSGVADPTKVFYINQMLKGYVKLGSRLDTRLPITLPLLHRLIDIAHQFSVSQYEIALFQAMCATAFHAFLRVGEMTATRNGGAESNLSLTQLTKMVDSSGKVVSLKITFLSYKHNYNQRPFSVIVTKQFQFCPVDILLVYLSKRGIQPGFLFVLSNRKPVPRNYFAKQLAIALKLCNLSSDVYKGHSFRIGAASHAADRGMSDAQIRSLGRWKSNAFLKYIRLPSLSS